MVQSSSEVRMDKRRKERMNVFRDFSDCIQSVVVSVVIKRKIRLTIQSLLEVIMVNEGRKGQNVFRETCVHIQSVVEIRFVHFF